ncbi:hypothetical protein BGZ94_000528 [Podila epigama]|nr:hypothetical protein BGZ94_000528 [Podila epigama]
MKQEKSGAPESPGGTLDSPMHGVVDHEPGVGQNYGDAGEDENENADEGDDDDDDDDWEEVNVSIQEAEDEDEDEDYGEEDLSGPWQYSPVEIVFDKPLEQIKKAPNRGVTKEQRMIRVLIHQTHLLCLMASGLRRNKWINHPKFASVALSLVPNHIAASVQETYTNPVREVNALHVLALWWKDSFCVTGPGIRKREYVDVEAVGVEAAIPVSTEECLKKRKNLQRKLLNRSGSSDVCSQLFTGICRSLGLKTRLVESLQSCPFKVTIAKDDADPKANPESSDGTSKARKGKRKKVEPEIDEEDTTRGSRRVIATPHRTTKRPSAHVAPNNKAADPPVFWTEVYSSLSNKWITIDPVRGVVNNPLKLHPASSCTTNVLSYVVAYDSDSYVTDVTRRYTSQWGMTKKLRVQPAVTSGFDWWAQTMSIVSKPYLTPEEELEQAELLQAEVSERMPTKLGDFNNHPLYALERHIKKFEVLHPRIPVLGHIRGEAIYPRSCVKQVRSKENWLKRARQLKPGPLIPAKWVRARPSTIFQMRLQQQTALSGATCRKRKISAKSQNGEGEDEDDGEVETKGEGGDDVPLYGEWQTEPYQPPYVMDGRVPRNEYGRQDVFTPAMVPIGGTHLKGRNISRVARMLGVDSVEAVTGFEFQSRRSVPVVDGIIVPIECAELVMDGYRELSQHADEVARKKKRTEVLQRWRKMIKGVMVRARLREEYGDMVEEEDDKASWVPDDEDEDREPDDRHRGRQGVSNTDTDGNNMDEGVVTQDRVKVPSNHSAQGGDNTGSGSKMEIDSGGGFMLD